MKRLLGLLILLAFLAVLTLLASNAAWWQSNVLVHGMWEVTAAFFALFVGVVALIRHYAREDTFYLFLGAGFLGTAALDFFHLLVATDLVADNLPSATAELSLWSWTSSRVFLAVALCLALASRWIPALVERRDALARGIAMVTTVVVLLTVVIVSFIPLPAGYFPGDSIHRPGEFVAGTLLAIALTASLFQRRWLHDRFAVWLVAALLIGAFIQLAVIPYSGELYDALFDLAHLLKVMSYVTVLIGLLLATYDSFVAVEHALDTQRELDRAKSEFMSTVSHELRTPLTSIHASLGMMVDGMVGEMNDDQSELVRIAHQNSNRLVALINDLLDVERLAAGRVDLYRSRMDLGELLATAVAANAALGNARGVTIELARGSATTTVNVDEGRMMQVMANLLSNAIKFSPDNGVVEVRQSRGDGVVRVEVEDHGAGIPPEFQSRVFTRFAQADSSNRRERGGTGLGLAVTKGLIEAHGGRIGFSSEPGTGTTFWFELPA